MAAAAPRTASTAAAIAIVSLLLRSMVDPFLPGISICKSSPNTRFLHSRQMAVSLAKSRAARLCVHPLDPLSARCGSHEWIRKILCFPRNLVVPELHDAHGVGRLAVIRQDEFGDPKITAANDSPDRKPLLVWLAGALALYVAPAAGSLAGLRVFQHRVLVIDAVLRFKIVGIGRRPMLIQCRTDLLISRCRILLLLLLIVHLEPSI